MKILPHCPQKLNQTCSFIWLVTHALFLSLRGVIVTWHQYSNQSHLRMARESSGGSHPHGDCGACSECKRGIPLRVCFGYASQPHTLLAMTRGERVSVTNHMNKHKLRVKSFKQVTQLEAGSSLSKVPGKMPLLKLQMIFTGLKSGTRSLSGNIPPLTKPGWQNSKRKS